MEEIRIGKQHILAKFKQLHLFMLLDFHSCFLKLNATTRPSWLSHVLVCYKIKKES